MKSVVELDGKTYREPSEPAGYLDDAYGTHGLVFEHDCINSEGNLFRSKTILSTNLYPAHTPAHPSWDIVEEDPLTVQPSIQCLAPKCTVHGFVTDGKWVRA